MEREKAQTYWDMGQVLHEHVLERRSRPGYSEALMIRLAEDLGMGAHTLCEFLVFIAYFKICVCATFKYGRYLADVFYKPGASDPRDVLADGLYLNQQLLDEGLAHRYGSNA